jgi:hypothetical protein
VTEPHAVMVALGGAGRGGRVLAAPSLAWVPASGASHVLRRCTSTSNVGCKPVPLPAFMPSEPTFAPQIIPYGLFRPTLRRPTS